ncbi:sialidase family protein [Cohnella fermenti]|uniref:exo-alpha-sialidase n=1 Tax=Cohnella fermenti TaxID=2565925 RepID=A0A4S4BYH2_9BACL|nr:sialidase family protein [Cohnella fermenti]THF80303.1 hypothetical protein E6C55_10470 [Cohnella fermenti]
MARDRIDWRNIKNGRELPKEHYCDQPYAVITAEGHWLCVMTTGRGLEGESGQHVVSTISADKGLTWTALVDIEPAGGPEASWAMPLVVPGGRVYVFYLYNADNIRQVAGGHFDGEPGEVLHERVDTLGYMVFKYSDDHGRTWSAQRHTIPIRSFEIDRRNRHRGEVQYLWGVGKPMVQEGAVYIGFAKVGSFGPGWMAESEGAFLRSDNILEESDPTRIRWQTLPEGDFGLRAPLGPVGDEHNPVGLNDGSLYCTFRTVAGHNAQSYSRDGGRSWTKPEHAAYSPGGRAIKHPRAANFVKKFANGKYLLWYHNHGRSFIERPWLAYADRNPAWVSGGVERDGVIHWSQPEVLLYDDDPAVRISYPDFIEDGGDYYVTETQKEIARVHPIDKALLEGMWAQGERRQVDREGLLLELDREACASGASHALPGFGALSEGGSFSLELWLSMDSLAPGQVVADATDAAGQGFRLVTIEAGALRLELSDGRSGAYWDSDSGILRAGSLQHVAVIVDGGPKLILFVADGVLCDGGAQRQFGWGRFGPTLGTVGAAGRELAAAPSLNGRLHGLRLYGQAMTVSQAVAQHLAGMEG